MVQTEFTLTASRCFWRIIPVERLRFRVLVALFTLMSMATLGTTLLARMRFTAQQLPDNPFLAYADIFPGQPWSSALAREFSCFHRTIPSPADVSEECIYHPQRGTFSQMTVTIWDGVVTRLEFTVRDNSLAVGDLAVWWGRPEVSVLYREWITLHWPHSGVHATAWSRHGEFSYFLPLHHVIFTESTRQSVIGAQTPLTS